MASNHPEQAQPDTSPENQQGDVAPQPVPMVTGADRSRRLVRAGIFALFGFLLLMVGVFVIGDKQNLFSETIPIYTVFGSVEGLKSGAAVMMNGIKIGTVSNVQLRMDTGTNVRVDMVLDGDYKEYLRTTTVATIGQSGLIGDKLIELQVYNVSSPLLQPGDSIGSVPPANYMAIVDEARVAVQNAESMTASLDTLFLRFRRGEGTLGKLITDEAAYKSIVSMTNSADQLFLRTEQQVSTMSGTLNRAAVNIETLSAEGARIMADAARGKGTIGALMYDRSLYDSLESLAGTLSGAAQEAGFAAREFGLNMRGLRNSWLVGGLFGGGDEEEKVELRQKELEIREEELRRQRQLLDQREREILGRERDGTVKTSDR